MNIFMLIPGIFELLEKVIGPVVSESKGGLMSALMSASPTEGGIMGAIQSVMGNIESEKLQEIKAQVSVLIQQAEIDQAEIKEGFFQSGWRPSLAWSLSILVTIHLTIAELYNINALYHGNALAPMDSMTTALLFGLLGLYMGARTVEKVNSNQ